MKDTNNSDNSALAGMIVWNGVPLFKDQQQSRILRDTQNEFNRICIKTSD